MLVFILVCITLCSLQFCNHLDEEGRERERERAGCFALIVLCLVTVGNLWIFLAVPWIGLQCVIFSDHTFWQTDILLAKRHRLCGPINVYLESRQSTYCK